MATLKTVVRPWGSSLGIIIPSEVVKEEGLKPKQEIIIEIKKADLSKLFGLAKFKKSAQKIKDEMRKGWGND